MNHWIKNVTPLSMLFLTLLAGQFGCQSQPKSVKKSDSRYRHLSKTEFKKKGGIRLNSPTAVNDLKLEMKLIHTDPGDSLSSVNAIEVTLRNSGTEPLTHTYRDWQNSRHFLSPLAESKSPFSQWLKQLVSFEFAPGDNYLFCPQTVSFTLPERGEKSLGLKPGEKLKFKFVVKRVIDSAFPTYLPVRTGRYKIRAGFAGIKRSSWQTFSINRGQSKPRGRHIRIQKFFPKTKRVHVQSGVRDGICFGDVFEQRSLGNDLGLCRVIEVGEDYAILQASGGDSEESLQTRAMWLVAEGTPQEQTK